KSCVVKTTLLSSASCSAVNPVASHRAIAAPTSSDSSSWLKMPSSMINGGWAFDGGVISMGSSIATGGATTTGDSIPTGGAITGGMPTSTDPPSVGCAMGSGGGAKSRGTAGEPAV